MTASRTPASDAAVLQNIEIPSPCTQSWDAMRGDEQVRHCGVCRKNVYNLSSMPQAQAAALLTGNVDGELCVRFYRRSDGTVMTSDCSTSPRVKLGRAIRTLPRMAAGAAGAAGAAAMVAAAAHAAPGQAARPGKKPTVVEVAIVKEEPPQPVMMGAPPPVPQPFVGKPAFKHESSGEGKPHAAQQPGTASTDDRAQGAKPPVDRDNGDAVR